MPMSALVVIAITAVLALGPSVSPAQIDSLQRLIRYEVDGGYRNANTESIYNLRPIMTLSIGVSFYSRKAQTKFPSLPAHALSAAMVVDSLDRSFQYRFNNDARVRLVTDLRMPPGQVANRSRAICSISRPLSRWAAGSRWTRIEMKMTLSIPRTISRAVRVSRAR